MSELSGALNETYEYSIHLPIVNYKLFVCGGGRSIVINSCGLCVVLMIHLLMI